MKQKWTTVAVIAAVGIGGFAAWRAGALSRRNLPDVTALNFFHALIVPQASGDAQAASLPPPPGPEQCASTDGSVTFTYFTDHYGVTGASCVCAQGPLPSVQCVFARGQDEAIFLSVETLPDDGDELHMLETEPGAYAVRGVHQILHATTADGTTDRSLYRASVVEPYGTGIVRITGTWPALHDAENVALFTSFAEGVRFVK